MQFLFNAPDVALGLPQFLGGFFSALVCGEIHSRIKPAPERPVWSKWTTFKIEAKLPLPLQNVIAAIAAINS